MGSSWRYRHVTTTPLLVLFHGLAFSFDGQALEFTRRWKTTGTHRSKQKKKIGPIGRPHLFTAFAKPGEPPLYPTRSHLLWLEEQAKLHALASSTTPISRWFVAALSMDPPRFRHSVKYIPSDIYILCKSPTNFVCPDLKLHNQHWHERQRSVLSSCHICRCRTPGALILNHL